MKTEKKKPEHYVNNKEFTAAVVAHNISVKEAKAAGEVPPVSYTHLTLPTTPYV